MTSFKINIKKLKLNTFFKLLLNLYSILNLRIFIFFKKLLTKHFTLKFYIKFLLKF